MIPVKLYLQNFMAYKAAETLNFADIHIACLSGENGAGKSSLLDAITWSLWGKARISHNDSLIHLGETDMEVEFSFELSGETYRVLRRRSSAKQGKTELHFHIADAGGWRTLTESSMRKTQEKIDRLLRLDYDTFINSAFLLQGRADEFTNKTPGQRKQILAEILGLDIYDEYEEVAKEEVRCYQQEIKIIEGQMAAIDEELAREAEYRLELEQSQTQAASLKQGLNEVEQNLIELRGRHKELDLKQRQLEDLEGRLADTQADIDELSKIIADTQAKIAVHQALIAQKAEIEAGYQAWQKAQEELKDWERRLAQSTDLLPKKHRLETTINQARTKLESDIQYAEARLAELRPKVEAIPTLQTDLVELEASLTNLNALSEEREVNRQKLEALTNETADLKAKNKQLKDEMNKIESRLSQLKTAGAVCPVCAQPLNETHRQQVEADFMAEGKARGDDYRANLARQKEIQREHIDLTNILKQADQALKRLPMLQAQHATKKQTLEETETARDTLAEMEANLTDWRQKLANNQFEVEAIAQLADIEAELAQLGYDSKAHKQVQSQVESLAHFADEQRQLENAQTRLAEEQTRLTQEQARQTRLLKQIAADRTYIDQLKAETAALPDTIAELSKVNQELDKLQKEEYLARSAVVAAEQKLNHVAQLAKERGKKEEKVAELKETMSIYQELRAAFGKNGVQALLIENTIPELEDEANTILSRMTDGRMHLQFITQRETKSGQNLIETLDIRIADEVGTRNYELYSGGEAFRINFAIRIALSKLLARRSGAKLQTLVIDEGFGTQDTQGRERLVEAINKIQHEFEKIIVITHIDELKDAFPSRIIIQKTPNGSAILVN